MWGGAKKKPHASGGWSQRQKQLSELRDMTEKLNSAEHEVNVFMQLCPVVMIVADRERYLKVNEYFCEITGWSEKELCHMQGFRDFIHPDDRDRTDTSIGTMDGDPLLRFRNRVECKDGSYIELDWAASPWTNGKTYATARKVTCTCNDATA